MLYLRQNVSQTVLAVLDGINQPAVSRINRSIMPLLDTRRFAGERAIGHLKNWKSSAPATSADALN
ncbi:transposase family protein [Kribbella sp. NPDC026611]|uniref:transposase family protein n=1 Tax=Kribbella sp. NPDC026611 TaxID=3154911 RepID=UPI0033E19D1A